MQIQDTAALITGGASGLGEATARHFAALGAKVTLLDRDVERGQMVADEIGATFAETDVTSEASVEAAVAKGKAAMGKITCAVNCAGIATGEKTLGKDGPHDLSAFQRTININLVGSFNVARLAAAEIAQADAQPDGLRGVIINTASIAAFEGQKGQTAYAASKGGIAGLSLPMARDLAREGIRVMAIAPGLMLTPMLMGLPQEVQDQLAQDVTCPRRLGGPGGIRRPGAVHHRMRLPERRDHPHRRRVADEVTPVPDLVRDRLPQGGGPGSSPARGRPTLKPPIHRHRPPEASRGWLGPGTAETGAAAAPERSP